MKSNLNCQYNSYHYYYYYRSLINQPMRWKAKKNIYHFFLFIFVVSIIIIDLIYYSKSQNEDRESLIFSQFNASNAMHSIYHKTCTKSVNLSTNHSYTKECFSPMKLFKIKKRKSKWRLKLPIAKIRRLLYFMYVVNYEKRSRSNSDYFWKRERLTNPFLNFYKTETNEIHTEFWEENYLTSQFLLFLRVENLK